MKALTLTQPWAGLVASGIKRVENRPRKMIKESDFGKWFAIHASRQIDGDAIRRVRSIAPELPDCACSCMLACCQLTKITSAIIGVAKIDKVLDGGWTAESIAEHGEGIAFSNGELIGMSQARWFFGPVGYLIREAIALPEPIPYRGQLGFFSLGADTAIQVASFLRSEGLA